MDFGWRFRQPTDATTFVTPNQMSEHARRRDLTRLRHCLSPCRGIGCAHGGTDSQSLASLAGQSSKRSLQRGSLEGRLYVCVETLTRRSKAMDKRGSHSPHMGCCQQGAI
jgi:hypothetical protein